MASYPPPSESFLGIIFNPAFFNNINLNGFATIGYVQQNFLARVGVASSIASLTSFSGAVTISGILTLTGGISISGGLTVDTLQVNSTSLFIGQSTFTLIPNLPANYQFITNGSQTIDGTKTFISIPVLPTGYQFMTTSIQTFTGAKTFSGVLTTAGINDSLSITSPNITGSTVVNGGYFAASNPAGSSSFYTTTINGILNTNSINNSSSILPYTLLSGTVAIPSGTNSGSGLQLGWNGTIGTGETNIINLAQGGSGGFQFGIITNSLAYSALCNINRYANQGLWLYSNCGRLRIDDRNGGAFWWGQSMEGSTMLCSVNGVSTSYTVGCGNSSGIVSTCLSINTSVISPNVSLNPLSTTTFNTFHPTTSLGNNISTNTTQYATVGYVNANSGSSILSTNNIFSGTNGFTQRFIQVGNATQFINLGCGTGNIANIVIGDSSSLSSVSASAGNICISGPATSSMYNVTGSSNICIGGLSGTLLSTGNSNLFLGSGCGQTITTGSNNSIIGASSWSTGGNFSNCTVLGANAPPPVSNNSIVLGSSSETVYVAGSSQLNNTLLYGTTVVSNNLQVNGNIIQPILSFTTGVTTTFTTLPPFVFFTPIALMSFVWPAPSASNSGQTFTIRRIATGGGQTINNTITGGISAWWTTSGTTAIANIAISTVWSFTFISNGTGYYQIA